ncbi:MAG: lytic transglycosylase domain-containing protein [Bacteroidota bacterium]
MKKLSLLVLPMGLIFSGITYAPEIPRTMASTEAASLRTLSTHLSTLELQAPQDLSFAGQLVPLDRDHVQQKLRRELKRHQYYYASNMLMHKRAARYQATFRRILRQHGVPEDFFYLAMAESGLSNAISPVGAKGFWQFMPATAREYGLEVNAAVDERYHPEKSAHAAAYYLKDAYERLGDWTLVAASYNMGQAGVARQVRRQGKADYFDLKLNA